MNKVDWPLCVGRLQQYWDTHIYIYIYTYIYIYRVLEGELGIYWVRERVEVEQDNRKWRSLPPAPLHVDWQQCEGMLNSWAATNEMC